MLVLLLVDDGLTVVLFDLVDEGELKVVFLLLFVVEVLLVVDCLVLVPTERLAEVEFL